MQSAHAWGRCDNSSSRKCSRVRGSALGLMQGAAGEVQRWAWSGKATRTRHVGAARRSGAEAEARGHGTWRGDSSTQGGAAAG